jgi:tetratricopeptide (TPR) repeat protein
MYCGIGEHDLALADFDRVIAINPDFAAAYFGRGTARHFKGDLDLAIEDYDRAIEMDPNDVEVYYNRDVAYKDKGDYDRAIADFETVLRIDPDYRHGALLRQAIGEARRPAGE